MKYKILFTETYITQEGIEYLNAHDCEVICDYLRWKSEDELIAALQGIDGVIAGGEKYSPKVINAARNLKIIARLGSGFDAVDIETASKAGILVTNTPGATASAVAELALGLCLSALRRIPQMNGKLKAGVWEQSTGRELSSCVVGIIGTGFIGREFARLIRPFGCKVLAFDVFKNKKFADEYGVVYVNLEEIAKNCDVISIHLPLFHDTEGMINTDFLSKMKADAYIINTSRGQVIDKTALKNALEQGVIAGAAIDAHWEEPCKPVDEIVILPNVICTPHIGYNTKETKRRMIQMASDEILAVLRGENPKYNVY